MLGKINWYRPFIGNLSMRLKWFFYKLSIKNKTKIIMKNEKMKLIHEFIKIKRKNHNCILLNWIKHFIFVLM